MKKYSRKLEHYCYLRYCEAKTQQAKLFWLNMQQKTNARSLCQNDKCLLSEGE